MIELIPSQENYFKNYTWFYKHDADIRCGRENSR